MENVMNDEERFWSGKKFLFWELVISTLTSLLASIGTYFQHRDEFIWWIPLAFFPAAWILTYFLLTFAGVVIVEDEETEGKARDT